MTTNRIHYFTEDIIFALPNKKVTAQWIQQVITQEKAQLVQLNFVFCSDTYLHDKNVKYLQHNTFTDVITFSHHSDQKHIEGDVYISLDRVRENSVTYGVAFLQELYRVMVHGVLHLLGYGDKTKEQQTQMRHKEDFYISTRSTM